MKRLLWLGLFFLSLSWLFFLPIFQPPQWIMGLIILSLGIFCNILAFVKNQVPPSNKKYLFFVILLFIACFFVPFPFSVGIFILLCGLLLSILLGVWSKYPRILRVWPGLFLSGVILLVQACIFPLYVKFAIRFHGTDVFSSVLTLLGKAFGLSTTSNGDTFFVGLMGSNPALTLSWENFGVFVVLNLFIGTIILFYLTNKKRMGLSLLMIFLISIIYMILRYLFLIAVLAESAELSQYLSPWLLEPLFYDPWIILFSFLPLMFLFMKFMPLDTLSIDFSGFTLGHIRKRQTTAFILIFCFIFLLVGSFSFQDPGAMKKGRVLIDEHHSIWEPTLRPVDTKWYGPISTYNYYSWADFLSHYYNITKNNDTLLTNDLLQKYDILILKCPTSMYSDQEVAAIIQFVKNGGGLFLIGDHTNVFGMNTYLNKVSRYFGLEFNADATHDLSALNGFSIYTPPAILPHPIVQHMSHFNFLTSCTLDAPLTAEEIIIGDKMSTFPGTYATAGFFTEEKKLEETRGLFLQAAAIKYDKGRVVAFTDSTTFSSFCFYLSGYKSFNLGVMNYLNRENTYGFLNIFLLITAIVCLAASIFLLWNEKKTFVLLFIISIGALSFSLAAPMFSALNMTTYPEQAPQVAFEKRICFDGEHSAAIIESAPALGEDKTPALEKQLYDTFFVWTQRVGCIPSVKTTLENALQNGDLVIILNPTKPFTQHELSDLSEYIMNGGKCLVMDTVFNLNSTANDLLQLFSMEIDTLDRQMNARIGGQNLGTIFSSDDFSSTGCSLQPYLTIQGGTPILTGEYEQPIFSILKYGRGLLAVFVDSAMFSEWKMGNTFMFPDAVRRPIYNAEYYILESLLYGEDDYQPASMTGTAFLDKNKNGQYDPLEDHTLSNMILSLWKIDNFTTSQTGKYSTSATTFTNEAGVYYFSQMMPGYYLVSTTTQEGILINQSIILLSSGDTFIDNISKVETSSLTGVTYYDNNKNATYDSGEEQGSVTVDLLYINVTGQTIRVASVVTDTDGKYTFFPLSPGGYILNASKIDTMTGHRVYSLTTETIFLPENTVKIFNVSLSLVPITVQGYLRYSNETKSGFLAAFYANRSINPNTATNFVITQSNASGFYTVVLLPGFYNISINQTVIENGMKHTYHFKGDLTLSPGEEQKFFDALLWIKE